ncbi:hypothetical protein PILCRDRAFT_354 [Piloderma croceum F 1598]|uniref:Uncharacterized protein n=1 Tax=Piloderma croceum (strain F 1598) TaxID=765440 RepID=A0A0C3C0C7_PILCF|nr:hypothetical protein PILCRDRAFT_354 [Piloderma croceum F 1598]
MLQFTRGCGVFTATTIDEWTPILALTFKWNFQSIKTLAVNHLSTIATAVDKIVLGRQYNIFEWLENAYTTLCWRDEALMIEKGMLLGVKDVIMIMAVCQGKNRSAFILDQ